LPWLVLRCILSYEFLKITIINKERTKIEYLKGVYKRRVQAEIKPYKDS